MTSTNDSERSSGVDWRGRQKRQRVFGTIKLILVVAILGVVAGLGIRFYPAIRAALAPQQKAPPPPPPPKETPPEQPKPPVKVVEQPKEKINDEVSPPAALRETKAVESQVVEAEDQRAQKLIAEGQQAMMDIDFVRAKKAFEDLKKTSPAHTEEVMEHCSDDRLCAYEIATSLAQESNVIVTDYFYLFNSHIRNIFLKRTGKELAKSIIIVDEGHNLSGRIRDLATQRLSNFMLKRAVREAKKLGYKEEIAQLTRIQDVLNAEANKGNSLLVTTPRPAAAPTMASPKPTTTPSGASPQPAVAAQQDVAW